MKIHQSAEDYLEKILMIRERKGEVHSIDIANELGFSKPSVSVAMKTCARPAIFQWTATAQSRWNRPAMRLPAAFTSATNF